MAIRKVGRPKGARRARVNMYVLPATKEKIEGAVDPSDPNRASMGKVVDAKFESES